MWDELTVNPKKSAALVCLYYLASLCFSSRNIVKILQQKSMLLMKLTGILNFTTLLLFLH